MTLKMTTMPITMLRQARVQGSGWAKVEALRTATPHQETRGDKSQDVMTSNEITDR